MPNPNVSQGTLNKIRASVVIPSFPSLNVTSPFLGRNGISLTFNGPITTFIDTLTGAVTSPEPYQPVRITINLLKTQPLAAAWRAQFESGLSLLGDITVRPDAATLPPYYLTNCGIETVNALAFAGEAADFPIEVSGYYLVNASLFN